MHGLIVLINTFFFVVVCFWLSSKVWNILVCLLVWLGLFFVSADWSPFKYFCFLCNKKKEINGVIRKQFITNEKWKVTCTQKPLHKCFNSTLCTIGNKRTQLRCPSVGKGLNRDTSIPWILLSDWYNNLDISSENWARVKKSQAQKVLY